MTRTFTGWHMTGIVVALFGVVIAVNVLMASYAIGTFGGTVVDNSYVASQRFNSWLAEARTQRDLGWNVDATGLDVVFDRAIPPFIADNLEQAVEEMCIELGIARDDIDRFCCHPGGVKVIDAIESALNLNQGELNLEREVLRDYGNMSAPTVMFVLERLLEQGLPGKVMMTAFGPGFTCAGLLLEAA